MFNMCLPRYIALQAKTPTSRATISRRRVLIAMTQGRLRLADRRILAGKVGFSGANSRHTFDRVT